MRRKRTRNMMGGSRSRSQKKDTRSANKKQRTVNSLVSNPNIIFERQFPHDIILEILSRATIGTLDACTHVSKGWIDLINDQDFIQFYQKKHNIVGLYSGKEWLDFISYQGFMYGKRNKKEFAGYIWQYDTQRFPGRRHHSVFVPRYKKNYHPSIRNWRIPAKMKILAACKQEGIIFCCDGKNYFVGMLALGKWIIMPEPDDVDDYQKWIEDCDYIPRPDDFVFGMVILGFIPLWYKVVKLAYMSNQIYYQIYDSKIRGWLKAGVVELNGRPMVSCSRPTISISESIYWQTTNGYVLGFNGLNNSFHLFELPPGSSQEDVRIHEFNGRLEFSNTTYGEMELWEIDEINNNTWRKRAFHNIRTRRKEGHEIWYTREQDEIIIHGEDCGECQIFPFGL